MSGAGVNAKIKQPMAEEVGNYYKTSKIPVDGWLSKAKREITSVGGKVTGEGYLSDLENGRAAIMLAFTLEGRIYKATWPVLPTRHQAESDRSAARIQAATALYHDIKARVVNCKFRGISFSFLNYQVLPTGQTVSEAADMGVIDQLPALLQPPRRDE